MKPPHQTLRVVAFDGGWNLPIWIGQQQGFFAAAGVDLVLAYTPNSAALVDGLIDGTQDIAFAAADNFIARRESESTQPASAELFMLAGGDAGFLSLVTASDISEVAQLRGRRLAVDALSTGFAFVARELLERRGIAPNEVQFEKAGGTDARYRALITGQHA
jgi:ABC-type nitrate/sulfonate/bicarbonate transport system substrate-binding protein